MISIYEYNSKYSQKAIIALNVLGQTVCKQCKLMRAMFKDDSLWMLELAFGQRYKACIIKFN